MPLTNTRVKNTKPTGKTQKLFDGGGLYLEVSPKGGTWWRQKYRFNGKEKRISLGVYPDVSLKQARDRRDDARRLLADGIDPSEHRKNRKFQTLSASENSFEVIALEWHTKQKPTWSEVHADKTIRLLQRDIFPWLGRRPVSEITASELLAAVRRIEERGAIDTTHRALNVCGQIFRYAIATARAERDIATDLKGALPPVKRTHLAAVTEPLRAGEILRALEGYNGTLIVKCALRLAPLVFVRPGELRHAHWADIDLENGEWRFVVSKTNTPHIVPLARQAIKILEELEPLTGKGEYVFPSARSRKNPMSDNAVLSALRRMDISKEEMSGHGFRAMARTILDEVLGFRPDFIEHQLAHAVRDPNGRAYNRTAHLEERRKMMQAWADYLENLKSGANVLTMRRYN